MPVNRCEHGKDQMEDWNLDISGAKADIARISGLLEKLSSGLVSIAELFAEFDEPDLANRTLDASEKSYHLLMDIRAIERRFDFSRKYASTEGKN